MKIDTINPFEGTIELNWPGKQCKLLFEDNHWMLVPNGKETTKRALLFEKRIGEGKIVIPKLVMMNKTTPKKKPEPSSDVQTVLNDGKKDMFGKENIIDPEELPFY